MKKATMIAAAICAGALFAQETAPAELVEGSEGLGNFRIMAGGFGRGNMRTKLKGTTADHEQLWGADMDFQYRAWQRGDFGVWLGVGGTFCPSQDAYGRRGKSRKGEHQVSDDGFVTYDFGYSSNDRRSVDLGYGELRLVAVPEWNALEHLSIGARIGVAFDWMRAKCRRDSLWMWNSSFSTDIPGIPATVDTDSDSGRTGESDSETVFAAQAILGLQATYQFADNIGLYAACDWRLGGDSTFKTNYGDKYDIDMSGWCASVGVVFRF